MSPHLSHDQSPPHPGPRGPLRRGHRRVAIAMVSAALLAFLAPANLRAQSEPDDTRDGRIEVYLRDRGLDALLAEHLQRVLSTASGTRRVEIAERLGGAYARILAVSRDPIQRDDITARAGELLETVPAADTFDLRIALIKSRYLRAEDTAERVRLRLIEGDEQRDAADLMDSVAGELAVLADRAERRVIVLERRERSGGVSDITSLRAELAEARRQRSLANYYAGWSNYYGGMLSGDLSNIDDALESFGYLLGAEGKEPEIANMPKSLLRYEHVARAAVGVALCHGLRNDHRLAVDWLGGLEDAEDANPDVLAQLFSRRVTILTGAKRWDTLARAVEQRREAGLAQPSPNPLRVTEARLLAVEILESLRAMDATAARRAAAEPIVQSALADLITRGETGQVLDLVERYGTLPIGDEGFIAQYVRGLRAYRAARELHEASASDASEPTREPELVAAYLEAADLLIPAFESPESVQFPEDRIAAGLMLGMTLYYKDTPAEAAERFQQTAVLAGSGPRHAESLWMSVVSLERALETGRADLEKRLHATAALFVRTYPGTDRAARLLLRFADAGIYDADEAVAILLEIDRKSPMYAPARAHIADTLYRAYVRSREPERSALAARFLPVVIERIEAGVRALRAGDSEDLDVMVLRLRQTLDAALTPLVTDPVTAKRALAAIDEIRARAPEALAGEELAGELVYRRLQLAIALGDDDAIRSAEQNIQKLGGDYLKVANRFLFDRALAEWNQSDAAGDARRVVELGTRLIGDGEIARTDLFVADAVARAATALWTTTDDRVMLTVALDLDQLVLSAHTPTSALLRRIATNAQSAGDAELAERIWTRLAASLPSGDPDWYEARYESIRALAERDPASALAAVQQHAVLYPDLGPAPWGQRFETLRATLESGGRP